MEDLKKLILPAIVSVILHGFLFGFKLPKQQMMKPVLKAAPIEIQINSVSPLKNIPKKVEPKKEKKISKPKPEKKVVPKQIIKPPVVVPEQLHKKEIVPELKQKEPIIEEIEKKIDLQKQPLENQLNNENENPPAEIEEITAEPIIEETTETTQTEYSENDPDETFSKEVIVTPPIQKKAVPIYQQNSQPLYPVLARRRGQEGELLLRVLVDAGGNVSELKVKHSSGHLSLDRSAVKAVKGWLFTPAIEGGKFVAMWVDIPIIFQLE